jgi:hypothetical protein
MTSTTGEPVVVSRLIEARAGDIFRILADPGRHPDLDGSGMLRGGISDAVVSGVGDVFVMRMHYERYGDYEMNNQVVEYEPVVTEIFDGSRMPEDKRAEVDSGRAWWQPQMASTLERLAELCAAR